MVLMASQKPSGVRPAGRAGQEHNELVWPKTASSLLLDCKSGNSPGSLSWTSAIADITRYQTAHKNGIRLSKQEKGGCQANRTEHTAARQRPALADAPHAGISAALANSARLPCSEHQARALSPPALDNAMGRNQADCMHRVSRSSWQSAITSTSRWCPTPS